jgi:4-alpha-glucanotransferase
VYGPGADLFRAVTAEMGDVAIIAEDLGDIEEETRAGLDAIQAEFGYPGMKVLQFAFGDDADNDFLPHNFTPDYVVYTGTHDNDTVTGWYQVSSTQDERDYARRYMAVNGPDIAWDLIRLGWGSVANTAMTTAQDLLSLGHDARMNTPSTVGPQNWTWRLRPGALNDGVAGRLREMNRIYGRLLPDSERPNTSSRA